MDDSNKYLSLRNVISSDKNLLFKWANDPEVRKWSFNKAPITLDEHQIWFEKKLYDSKTILKEFV